MPGHVGQRLDDDPVRRHLAAAGRSARSSGAVTSTATGSPSRLRGRPPAAAGPAPAELIESRWPHRVDHPSDLLDRCHGVGAELGHHVRGGVRVGADQVAGGVGGEGHAGEPGTKPSWSSRRSRRRSSSTAAMVWPRDSIRSSARARARRVWASRGTVSRRPARRRGRRPGLPDGVRPRARRRRRGRGCACAWWPCRSCQGLAVDQQGGVRHDQRLTDRPERRQRVLADPAHHLRRGAERVGSLAEQQLVDHSSHHHLGGVEQDGGQGRRRRPARRR